MSQITESARDGVPHSFNAADDVRDDRGEVEVVAMVAMVPVVVVRDVDVVFSYSSASTSKQYGTVTVGLYC